MPPVYNGLPPKSYRTLGIEHKEHPEVNVLLALKVGSMDRRAQRIVEEGLKTAGWSKDRLERERKGHPL